MKRRARIALLAVGFAASFTGAGFLAITLATRPFSLGTLAWMLASVAASCHYGIRLQREHRGRTPHPEATRD